MVQKSHRGFRLTGQMNHIDSIGRKHEIPSCTGFSRSQLMAKETAQSDYFSLVRGRGNGSQES